MINLLVTNLITCWVLLPSMLADNVWRLSRTVKTDDWRDEALSAVPCLLFEGAAVCLCVACVLSVVMIGVDQYFAVVDPLRYHASIKATTSVLMIMVAWTVAAVFGVLGAFSADGGCAWYACERLADSGASSPLRLPQCYRLVFAGLFVAFAFVAPFGAICWIYLSICSAARQNHRRAKRNGSAASCGNGAPQEAALLEYASTIREYVEFDDADEGSPRRTPPPPSSTRWPPPPPPPAPSAGDSPAKPLHHSSTKGSLKSTSSSIVNSLRHRISNASMFRYREETRAARISVLVIVMALFCWLPFTLVLVARSPLLLAHLSLPHYVKQMGILSLSSNAVVSPLIFAHRNRRIHRELCRLFRVSRRRASFYGIGDVKHATRRQRTPAGARRPPFRDSPPVADCERPVKRRDSSPALSPSDACVATAVAVAKAAAVTAAAADSAACAVAAKARADDGRVVDHPVSILNRLWRASKEAERERHRKTFRLPEVAVETDTSRSSFSSNASTGSHHRSTSLASVSDAAAADDY